MNLAQNFARPQGASLIDPTTELFYSAADKTGGPTEITSGFQQIYTEIYIKKLVQQNNQPSAEDQDGDGDQDESDYKDEGPADNTKTENQEDPNDEPMKKKRGRKPKSFYENLAKVEKE